MNDYLQKYANQSTLAEYANNINLSIFLKIQKGDNLDNNKSILSDVVESIIGAIYLDSDLVRCKDFILNEIVKKHSSLPKPIKHPKSTLQEYCLDKYNMGFVDYYDPASGKNVITKAYIVTEEYPYCIHTIYGKYDSESSFNRNSDTQITADSDSGEDSSEQMPPNEVSGGGGESEGVPA